jgi:ABC-type nickel/cobalt efflux system permease component RcnA
MIDIGSGAGAALALGFLLGLKHASDADHVVAVATVVGDGRSSVWRGIWIGASWGLGHTVPLVVVGVAILALKGQFMSTYEGFATYFEFAVGLMLVALGAQVLWNLARRRLHLHEHLDGGEPHVHIHASHKHEPELSTSTGHGDGGHSHGLWSSLRPNFRPRSFAIGMVHGLAGSAAVMLALLPEIESGLVGVGYLALFGVGTIVSMAAITLALGTPLKVAANMARMKVAIIGVAGVASLAIGAVLMAEVASGTAVIPF